MSNYSIIEHNDGTISFKLINNKFEIDIEFNSDNTGNGTIIKKTSSVIRTMYNQRLSICNACDDQACPAKHKTPCQLKSWLRQPLACCPNHPPKWTPENIEVQEKSPN